MTHPLYAVGLRDQDPLLLVVASAGASNILARIRRWELVGARTAGGNASRPVWSRAVTAGAGYSTLTPGPLNPFSRPSRFQGRYAYGVPPSTGSSPSHYPVQRSGFGQRVEFPEGTGPIFSDDCNIAVTAALSSGGGWSWSVNIVFEEL